MGGVVIVDYDRGNLRSVQKGFEAQGVDARVSREPKEIEGAGHVVLPGVGAFADCMANLTRFGLVEPVVRAIEAGRPFLGICLGMQLLFSESAEFGPTPGLGLIPGRVEPFPTDMREGDTRLKVPHMGWNRLHLTGDCPLFSDTPEGTYAYFVHSFHAVPDDLSVTAATTQYGILFVSAVWRDNVVACQFHPEKSDRAGLAMLGRFARWRP